MTFREARRKLGSRNVRRAGIRTRRMRSGSWRVGNKVSVAVRTRQILKQCSPYYGLG